MIHYSPSTRGFYDSEIHLAAPADAVPVNAEQYRVLMEGQSTGKSIVPDADGRPVLQEPEPLSLESRVDLVKAQRADAYREEADPLYFKAERGEVDREEWLTKVNEIRERFPIPTE